MIDYVKNDGRRYYGLDHKNKIVYLWAGSFNLPDDFPFALYGAVFMWHIAVNGRHVSISGIRRPAWFTAGGCPLRYEAIIK